MASRDLVLHRQDRGKRNGNGLPYTAKANEGGGAGWYHDFPAYPG